MDARRVSESLEAVGDPPDRIVRCRKCKHPIGHLTQNWKASSSVIRRVRSLSEARAGIPASDQVEWRQWVCPGCATLLNAEVALKGDPDIWDYRPLGS
ncbi:MAG: hypothetical protein HY900_35720 [Deltaproteobacteria bacterium]|nr:hypothetical protein [Deltaproteobacteria bacterium]